MKISHFPDFLPDETVYSVASRYMDRMQFPLHTIVSQQFFGRPCKGGVMDFPSSLDYLTQALPSYHTYTSDAIIDNNTLLPLYAPFMPPEKVNHIRQQMKSSATIRHSFANFAAKKAPSFKWLRYCPSCIEDDREIYGECYWHRTHQVLGVLVCPIHEIMLENSQVNLFPASKLPRFCSAEQSVGNLPQHRVHIDNHATLLLFAKNVKWLLEHITLVEQNSIQNKYMELFRHNGFATIAGKMRYTLVKEAMLKYYSPYLLESLGCGISEGSNWLQGWGKISYPLHHLLLIQLLCENVDKFFTIPESPFAPFGNGPWPCLNPLCPHYKEYVITTCSLKQASLSQPIIGMFGCVCGFTYTRTNSEIDNNDVFRPSRISQYGDLWDQCLTTYWLNEKISKRQIAKQMHVRRATVSYQAARLNLPFAPEMPCRGQRPKIYRDVVEEYRSLYRDLLEEQLKTHPDMTQQNVPDNIRQWMKRNDPEWFQRYFPDVGHFTQKNLTLARIQLRHKSYSLVDSDWATLIRDTVEEILLAPGFPVRITRKLLISKIGHFALCNKSNIAFKSLSQTSRALDESVETYDSFTWRKLRWVVESCLAKHEYPSYEEFICKARIGISYADRPVIKQLIQIAYSKLGDGFLLSSHMPEISKKVMNYENYDSAITYGSLTYVCNANLVISQKKQDVYRAIPLLLIITASVLQGANTYDYITKWCYQNEESIYYFGIPKGKFPSRSVFSSLYTKVNIEDFENVLGDWLRVNFPLAQSRTNETTANADSVCLPGSRLLWPYQPVASAIIAKLR